MARNLLKIINILQVMLLFSFSSGVLAQEIQVTARALSEVSISTDGRAPATVMASNHTTIAAQISGVIESIDTEVARNVEAGQLLVLIEARDFELNVELRRASLRAQDARIDQAARRLERARDLNDRNFTSVDDLHARETDLAVLKADREGQVIALAQAERELEKTRVLAPFSGTLLERMAQVGAYVSPGMPLLTLVQTDSAELESDINPVDVESLTDSTAIMYASEGKEWPVELIRLSSVIGVRSRVHKARLSFVNGSPPVGSSGYLLWRRARQAVPADLVIKRGSELGVFIVDGGNARFVPLPQAQEGRPTQVDLPANSLIIVGGRDRVEHGDLIVVDS